MTRLSHIAGHCLGPWEVHGIPHGYRMRPSLHKVHTLDVAGGRQTAKQHPTRLSKEPCPFKTCVYGVYTSTQAELNTTKLRLSKASGITTRRRCHLKSFRIANLLRNCQIGKESGCRDTQSLPEESR